MGLRDLAESDLGHILEDDVAGFGWPITLINQDGEKLPLKGYSQDISEAIDPDTGQAVVGRKISVALRTSKIRAANFELPFGVADQSEKPWLVQFENLGNILATYKVADSKPDRTLGIIVCDLELYLTGD